MASTGFWSGILGRKLELPILGWALGIGVNLYGHVVLCTLNDGQSCCFFPPNVGDNRRNIVFICPLSVMLFYSFVLYGTCWFPWFHFLSCLLACCCRNSTCTSYSKTPPTNPMEALAPYTTSRLRWNTEPPPPFFPLSHYSHVCSFH